MPIKANIGFKGKTYKVEIEAVTLEGKSLGDTIPGAAIKPELEGYEIEITGGSDISGFPMSKKVEGIALRKILLTKGWGMRSNIEGMRRRKTVRGKLISDKVSQLNMKVLKEGKRSLAEIFPAAPSTESKESEKEDK